MEWFKKHVDTVIILGAFGASVLWMNGKFTEVDMRFSKVDQEFAKINQELAVLKTVLIMQKIMPVDLAASGQ